MSLWTLRFTANSARVMKAMSVKLVLVLVLIEHCLLTVGQSGEKITGAREDYSQHKKLVELALQRMTSYIQLEDNASVSSLPASSQSFMRHVEIVHTPSSDFNIYLAFNNSVTPKIMTSFEVSLNYAGVMNVKSLIFLRRDQ